MRWTVTLPLALLAGFAIGFAWFRGPAPLSSVGESAKRAARRTAVDDPRTWPDSSGATDEKVQRLIAVTLRKGNRLKRQAEMYLIIEALTADDFRRVMGDVGALKVMAEKLDKVDWPTRQAFASGLIGRWLKVDHDAAMAWVPRMLTLVPKEQYARGLILDTLAQKAPEEMLALVASRRDAGERNEVISRAVRELALQDVAKARAWVEQCTDPADRRSAEAALRQGMVQVDPLCAIELAKSMTERSAAKTLLQDAANRAAKMGPGVLRALASSPMEPWMISSLAGQIAQREPELALDLLLKPGTQLDSPWPVRQAFAVLAQRDPAQAIARLENLTDLQRNLAVSGAGMVWADRDPAAALAWLATRPRDERTNETNAIEPQIGDYRFNSNDALLVAYGSWVTRAEGEARAWADALPAGETRDSVQTRLAQILAIRGEPVEAARLLGSYGAGADSKAVWGIADSWAAQDPQAAADWAVSLPAGTLQSRALACIVGRWANSDQQGVADWLSQFPAGEARDRSVMAFLNRSATWLNGATERNAEFDAWFGLIDDPWQRTQVALTNFQQRNAHDPAAARAWLTSLPNLDPAWVRIILRDNH